MKQKILALLNELNHGLVEREQTLQTALLTVLAGENLVLIGPPGTGKSLIARRIAESFAHENDNSYFEYLLTKFSTPEEIFGPLSISELKADRFKRNTAGYLPSVKIAFLDEIFKASSSILNALLTILNERLYHNGATAQKVPLQALIAASNELPTDQEELNALYDRFLVRSFVDYVRDENLLRLFEHTEEPNVQTPITADDLAHIKNTVQGVTIPPEIAEVIQTIWIAHKDSFKEDRREYLSDRRLKKVLHLLRVSAVTNGRSELDLSDVLLLKDCLWNHQENALKVRELILKTLQRYSRLVPKQAALENDLPLYEFDDDGKTLIPVLHSLHSRARLAPTPTNVGASLARETLSRETKKTGQLNAKERGYKGLGTAEDPILIENVQDLMGLDGIGQKGYYFLQTADIDCTVITTWSDINLQGHYDGGGHFVQYQRGALFQGIQAKSSVKNLELRGLNLAKNVAGSHIEWCKSDKSLINDNATDCTITACQSGSSLILNMVKNCTIRDCSLVMYEEFDIFSSIGSFGFFGGVSKDRNLDGISRTLANSTVERCLVTGEGEVDLHDYDYKFYGVTRTCDASTIRQCAIGRVELKDAGWGGRITNDIKNNSTLENNISIDSNPATQNDEKKDGKSISPALFNQRYFEHTLGWDFQSVWQWDDQKNHPVLRSVGANAKAASPAKPTAPQADTVDLLTQQIHANIWL
ncbi:MAG: AAA family ATPase [Methylococcales bacterium]|nr:AAA family ATPase [Methylococcales bacterium]